MSGMRISAPTGEPFRLVAEDPRGVFAIEFSPQSSRRGPGLWLPNNVRVRAATPADRGGQRYRVAAFTNPNRGADCYVKFDDMYMTSDGRLVACYGCRRAGAS
jgi:hypothetical protein